MNGRVVAALLICASGLGFAVGYGWPRDPVADPAAKQLLSLTDKIATDVVGIQRTLAREASRCPTESAASAAQAKKTDSGNKGHDAEDGDPTGTEYAALRQQADVIVMRGISSGRWTDNDVRELRAATNGLSGAQKQSVVAPLLQAINSQQVKLEVEHGGVL